MPSSWILVLVIALNLAFSTVGDICAKLWGETQGPHWLIIGLLVNLVTIFFFMLAIRLGTLATTTALVLLLTLLINATVGFLVFHERINPSQWAGMALGCVAIFLIAGALTGTS